MEKIAVCTEALQRMCPTVDSLTFTLLLTDLRAPSLPVSLSLSPLSPHSSPLLLPFSPCILSQTA